MLAALLRTSRWTDGPSELSVDRVSKINSMFVPRKHNPSVLVLFIVAEMVGGVG